MTNNLLPSKIVLIFIDGIGIGENDRTINPCAIDGIQLFNHFRNEDFPKDIIYNGIALGVDANLGVDGLPQSATGQTTLFTGINASKLLGRHLNGFPNQKLRDVLIEQSILKILKNAGKKCAFLNAFRPPFFDYDLAEIIRHLSVTTVMNFYAGLPFFGIDDILAKKAVYQDIINKSLIEKGFEVPQIGPEVAGEIVANQSKRHDFLLFEYFQTDRAGHSRDRKRAEQEMFKLEIFLKAILDNLEKNTLLIVTSDHGNIEDLSVKGHTRNPSMTLLFGPGAKILSTKLKSLTDFVPAIKSIFSF